MIVKIFKLGEDDLVTVFPSGTHLIGRGPALQCTDKRVSRNHATFEVTQDDVKITSNHVNPCFLKVANSKTITMLQKDQTSKLNDGDTFALLPDTYWFKVKIEEDSVDSHEIKEEIVDPALKRRLNGSNEQEVPEKRAKIEGIKEEDAEPNQTIPEERPLIEETGNGAEPNQTIPENATGDPTQELDENSSADAGEGSTKMIPLNENLAETAHVEEPVEEPNPNQDKADDETAPSTSDNKPKARRERCWYGAECYRKNPMHRDGFTHPGDSDFESDPDDDRPTCSFGAACYRRNQEHRKNYKHPPRQPPKKLPKKRTRKKVDRLNAADYDDDDLSDVSEDPFIADDSEDEYVEDSDDDDTDWEDSQKVDEDSENMKRLVKEANRFIKK